jgi:DNA repair protein RecN (Recombination protein N)
VARTRDQYLEVARTLSARRRMGATALARTLERGVADLAMARTRFEVVFKDDAAVPTETDWTERGIDQAEFFFSANPGENKRPLARIASGGELSRVMLALRTVTSPEASGKTLVFDEVDAGIGGEAADRVGAKMRALADRYQVLCVTHLPQIAVYGTSHYRITKRVNDGRTGTEIQRLTDDEDGRASEIARMMAGARVSGQVLQSARDLLAIPSEQNTKQV